MFRRFKGRAPFLSPPFPFSFGYVSLYCHQQVGSGRYKVNQRGHRGAAGLSCFDQQVNHADLHNQRNDEFVEEFEAKQKSKGNKPKGK